MLLAKIPDFTPEVPSNLIELGINLACCILASFVLRKLYISKSISLSGKFHIGVVIPVLACTTFLVILVVKSSLALSLGLVGALSVIRFRTPIKEPEELVYLFLSIAIGIGYGAGQTLVTSLVLAVVYLMILVWLSRKSMTFETEYNLLLDWSKTDITIQKLLEAVGEHASMIELQKYDTGADNKSVFLRVNLADLTSVQAIVDKMRGIDPSITCSFYQARPLQ